MRIYISVYTVIGRPLFVHVELLTFLSMVQNSVDIKQVSTAISAAFAVYNFPAFSVLALTFHPLLL